MKDKTKARTVNHSTGPSSAAITPVKKTGSIKAINAPIAKYSAINGYATFSTGCIALNIIYQPIFYKRHNFMYG